MDDVDDEKCKTISDGNCFYTIGAGENSTDTDIGVKSISDTRQIPHCCKKIVDYCNCF